MVGLLQLLALGFVLLFVFVVARTVWTLVYPPRKTIAWALAHNRPSDPSELDETRAFEAWTFESGNTKLPVWDLPGDAPDGPTIVCSHGWADSRLGALVRVPVLLKHASRLVLWDSTGHGVAPGSCHHGIREVDDLLALLDRVEGELVLYGWSLGAGVSIACGSRCDRVVGVIAEGPYRLPQTPARNVMRAGNLPWRLNTRPAFWIMGTLFGAGPAWPDFDRAAHAARLTCPLLVLHGTHDRISPPEDAAAIVEAARDGRLVEIKGGGHNNLWAEGENALISAEAVGRFLAELRRTAVGA